MLKEIPKDNSFKGNQHSGQSSLVRIDQKPKKEVTKELGFNKNQVERFETLAANKEIKGKEQTNFYSPVIISLRNPKKKKNNAKNKFSLAGLLEIL